MSRLAAPSALLVALTCLLVAPAARGAAPVADDATLQLAERLRAVGSFGECAVEAMRHAYLAPGDRERGFERAALCLGLAGRWADAERLLISLPDALGPRARYRLCWVRARIDRLPEPPCEPDAAPADRWSALASEMPVLHALRLGRWDDARARLAAAPPAADAMLASWRTADGALLERAARLPHRSPWLAGALSAVVPGLGRVYIGRWQDGLMSAVLIGVPAGFAANGFAHDGTRSVRGWILGTVAGVLYVGNVYGSAVGATVADRQADQALRAEAEALHLGRADPGE